MTPPICCTGTPVTQPDGSLLYKCGHVYRVVLRLREPEAMKPAKAVRAKEAA
jgi:hypothetical protein